MGADPRVLSVILNYKTADMTLRAIASTVIAMEGMRGEIVVVDNDSRDGSFETLTNGVAERGWSDRVSVLQAGRNGGFGAGNNVGILAGMASDTPPDFIYIQNSDAFPAPDALRILIASLENDPKAGFAGSYIHGEDGVPHETAFRFPSAASELEGAVRFGPISKIFRNKTVALPMPTELTEVDWCAGASVMMRREVLEEIGLFDETFFLYFEETDLCRRAKLAGWKVLYVPESRVEHIGSVSTGMKTWTRMPGYWFASRWYYFSKNHGRAYAAWATLAHLTGGALWQLRRLVQGKPQMDPDFFLRDMARHAVGQLPKAHAHPDEPQLAQNAPVGVE